MPHCWEIRGCDEEWMSRCPHSLVDDLCPSECFNADCFRPNHKVATDFELLLNPDRDYDAAVKECCHWCEFFLKHGPSMADKASRTGGIPDKGRQTTRFLI